MGFAIQCYRFLILLYRSSRVFFDLLISSLQDTTEKCVSVIMSLKIRVRQILKWKIIFELECRQRLRPCQVEEKTENIKVEYILCHHVLMFT